jgi:hypothetical protein
MESEYGGWKDWLLCLALIIALEIRIPTLRKNPEGHSPKWWKNHPLAKAKAEASFIQENNGTVPRKSIWSHLSSWTVIAYVVALAIGGGLSLMSGAPYIADVFFAVGSLVLILKLCTWSDYKVSERMLPGIAVALILLLALLMNHQKNNLYPFRLVSQIRFSCLATHIEYPNDRLSNHIWVNGFTDVRFTIDPLYAVGANKFEATLTTLNDRQEFEGMDQKTGDCKLHFLRGARSVELPDMYLYPKDGGPPANMKSEFEDSMDKYMPESGSYRITCLDLEPHDKLTVNMWMIDGDHLGHTPSAFKIKGSYETSASEASKRIPFDELCDIKQ